MLKTTTILVAKAALKSCGQPQKQVENDLSCLVVPSGSGAMEPTAQGAWSFFMNLKSK